MRFTLKGHQTEISYTPGSTPSGSTLSYKDDSLSRSFTKDEVHTDSTALGSLVSISLDPAIRPLERSAGSGSTTFAFFLPEDINVPHVPTNRLTKPGRKASMGICDRNASAHWFFSLKNARFKIGGGGGIIMRFVPTLPLRMQLQLVSPRLR